MDLDADHEKLSRWARLSHRLLLLRTTSLISAVTFSFLDWRYAFGWWGELVLGGLLCTTTVTHVLGRRVSRSVTCLIEEVRRETALSKGVIVVPRDFSFFPAGRTAEDGPYSGEYLRSLIFDGLNQHEEVVVDLRGTLGYGSSFLEECFGGLVTKKNLNAESLQRRLSFVTDDPSLEMEIRSYIGPSQVTERVTARRGSTPLG